MPAITNAPYPVIHLASIKRTVQWCIIIHYSYSYEILGCTVQTVTESYDSRPRYNYSGHKPPRLHLGDVWIHYYICMSLTFFSKKLPRLPKIKVVRIWHRCFAAVTKNFQAPRALVVVIKQMMKFDNFCGKKLLTKNHTNKIIADRVIMINCCFSTIHVLNLHLKLSHLSYYSVDSSS
jgi:hypothetical protein